MSKFVDCARDQAFLLPPDLRDWIPEDDLAHFVIEAVERVEMSAFKVNHRGTGSAQYHPRMMLALLIYCYANGIFSSRRIERATHRDIGVRFVAANVQPDHDTIATFRRENFAAVAESFLQVLLLAKELKLVKVGVVSVDGTKIDANGSKHRSVRYDRAGELVAQLKLEISALMARAEASDGSGEEDPQALPKELAHKHAEQGHIVALVSGASKFVLRPLAAHLNIKHIMHTHLEVKDGRFTGRVVQPICFGEGKIYWVQQLIEPLGIDLAKSYFYSDSITDLPLLEVVGHPEIVNPDPLLYREARRRHWPVRFFRDPLSHEASGRA